MDGDGTILSIREQMDRYRELAFSSTEHSVETIKKYYAMAGKTDDHERLAEMVTTIVFPTLNRYIDKELNILGITLVAEEDLNCKERVFEKFSDVIKMHLDENGIGRMGVPNSIYAYALALYLNFYSFMKIDHFIGAVKPTSAKLAAKNDWNKLKIILANYITTIVGETYDVSNRLNNIKTVHYLAPMMDMMANNTLKRLRDETELNEIPLEKLIKLTSDLGVTLAKITGESADRVELNVGFSQINQELQRMAALGVVAHKPERKLIE